MAVNATALDFCLHCIIYILYFCRDKKQRVCSKLCCMLPYPFISKNIDHIARLMELPFVEHSGTLPPVLVVNIQVPFSLECIFIFVFAFFLHCSDCH